MNGRSDTSNPDGNLLQDNGPYRIRVTSEDELDEHFIGVMIEYTDPFVGTCFAPGWECRHCGWRIGSIGFPPSHVCKGG